MRGELGLEVVLSGALFQCLRGSWGKGGDVTRQSWVEMREPGERRRTPPVASWCGLNVYALPPPHHISKP